MLTAFERMVAIRYLRARKQEGWVSVIATFSFLGITLGVATLIIVMSVMNGFRAELLGRILGLEGHFTVYPAFGVIEDYEAMAGRIEGLEAVTQALPLVETQALVSVGGTAGGALMRGLAPTDLARKPSLAGGMVAGDMMALGQDGVILGTRLAQRFRLTLGDRITLISPQGKPGPFGTLPRQRAFTVAGIFDVGMFEYDNTLIFTDIATAQTFAQSDGATAIEVMVQDPDRDLLALRRAIEQAAGPGVTVLDWQRRNASLFGALQVERNVMFLILSLIILVAAFNIVSSLIMLVKDKGRGIAILRTMGATRGMILRIFLAIGASVGIVGTLVGFGLGVAFCANIDEIRKALEALSGTELWNAEIRFLSQIPALIDPAEVTAVLIMALALTFGATIYPAWRAARLEPVEALRYE